MAVSRRLERVREELRESVTEHSSPREVAGSFAIGTFITMLPTLGVGLLLFVVLAYLFERINKIALLASVIVFNPVVKWGVYAGSFTLGILILGPVEGVGFGTIPSLSDGGEIVVRLLVGNLILAVVATVIAYLAALRLATAYDRKELPILEEIVDELGERTHVHEREDETARRDSES